MLMQATTEPAATQAAEPAVKRPESPVGKPIDRIDGKLKVTGGAKYAAEFPVDGVVHAVLVQSTIAKGTIDSIDTAEAEKQTGVIAIIHHKNRPELKKGEKKLRGESKLPFDNDEISYAGENVAVVVAETLDQARHAAHLVKVTYKEEKPVWDFDDPNIKTERPSHQMGEPIQYTKEDPDKALGQAGVVRLKQVYITPVEHHNPMELHATLAAWQDEDHLSVWDATQAVMNRKQSLADVFGLDQQNVRVICYYVGGGFGCKGDGWPHVQIAALCAKAVKKPVKLMLTRQQMFTGVGHRPVTTQEMTIGCNADGKIVALKHDTTTEDSLHGHHLETCGIGTSAIMYETPNLSYTHTLKRRNNSSATYMRAPGECPGTFAVEGIIDEMAEALKMDPLEFRRKNYAKAGVVSGKPFSTWNLEECFQIGAEKFGWSKRNPQPGSMKGPKGELIGWGMATATYPARRFPNEARIRLSVDASTGKLKAVGQCCTQDLGTGSWTIFTQMVSELTGLPIEQCKFELGDSNFPPGAVSGGSQTAAGVGQALYDACIELKGILLTAAKGTAVDGLKDDQVDLRDGKLVGMVDSSKSIDVAPLIAKSGKAFIEGNSSSRAKPKEGGDYFSDKQKHYTFQSFGVHFVEVVIDQPVPMVRVNRVVSVMDTGRIINPKTARSQVLGGVVMGIGMALLEETNYDPRTYRPMNASLSEYLVPVNPDCHDIQIELIDKPDPLFNNMGCRGIGEIGITGISAAIANAVWHATGKRQRELPITPDKLLTSA